MHWDKKIPDGEQDDYLEPGDDAPPNPLPRNDDSDEEGGGTGMSGGLESGTGAVGAH